MCQITAHIQAVVAVAIFYLFHVRHSIRRLCAGILKMSSSRRSTTGNISLGISINNIKCFTGIDYIYNRSSGFCNSNRARIIYGKMFLGRIFLGLGRRLHKQGTCSWVWPIVIAAIAIVIFATLLKLRYGFLQQYNKEVNCNK